MEARRFTLLVLVDPDADGYDLESDIEATLDDAGYEVIECLTEVTE